MDTTTATQAFTSTGSFAHATVDGKTTLCGRPVDRNTDQPARYADCRNCRVKVGTLRRAAR